MVDALAGFHPAVRAWFQARFPGGPTDAQALGWAHIASGEDTLIAAPTGSGKTLAGFLASIDALYRAAEAGAAPVGTQVVYVSPLKALAVDIHQNLEVPLAEIAGVAASMGMDPPDLRAGVRSGDTPSSARAAMLRRPPELLVTTPESLYLLVTAERGRVLLSTVRTVILDEIHAVARDKRGSHLAITLERLEELCEERPVRVGLSATQRPLDVLARLLVGAGPGRSTPDGRPRCRVVDLGHRRDMHLALEIPGSELEAVASNEQLDEVLDRIAELVRSRRTTLVFVNTRRAAERIAHRLGERFGEDGGLAVAAHHGSLSRERRLSVEGRLRNGELRALVATASLELGIDIGPVELVCQIGSPRSIATFLQRAGRSGHSLGGVPDGRLFPMTRDELVECAALLAAVRAGVLDAVHPPEAPLDILAQHVVAECAAQRWREGDLYELFRRAAPYEALSREDFDDVVDLLSEGIATGRGRRAAYLHRDGVNHELAGRRGARMAALTSGGAIPETADYRVVAEPDDSLVGTVNEDWAIESMAGDVFLLGSASWRIRRVEPGTVRVIDAAGAPPTVPFWVGEAPARTRELSEAVSMLRAGVDVRLQDAGAGEARRWVEESCGIGEEAAAAIVLYLGAARAVLGSLPTVEHIVLERFFDDSGGMQLVVHAPFGGRVNRALGLALRKRFCVTFDFELQAAATDDAVLLSLGPQHSFPLDSVPKFLRSSTVEDVLRQAALLSPMFAARWRWNLNRSLAVLRFRGGRRNPPPIQRMEADDLMAAVFPALAACQENATGPIEAPDHPLVRQTIHDCLHEAMDADGLRALVAAIERAEVAVSWLDTTEPSPLAHEVLNARPYAFLDDAPLEERRSRAVSVRRALPVDAGELAAFDPAAVARVREEVRPDPRGPDELHDLLLGLVVCRPRAEWERWHAELRARGRAGVVATAGRTMWHAAERGGLVGELLGGGGADGAAREVVRGHMEVLGPVGVAELVRETGLAPGDVTIALAALEQEGFALRVPRLAFFAPNPPSPPPAPAPEGEPGFASAPEGRPGFAPAPPNPPSPPPAPAPEGEPDQVWCSRRLLMRVHAYSRRARRREIEPVSAKDFVRFLLRWQHVAPGHRLHGRRAVLEVIDQLQGFELAAGAWEDVLALRVEGYRPEWLDELCAAGEIAWGRLGLRPGDSEEPSRAPGGASRATPVTIVLREDFPWLLHAARGTARPVLPAAGAAREVLDALASRGALFAGDLAATTRRMPSDIDAALWECVARGLVSADGFAALRALAGPRRQRSVRGRGRGRPVLKGASQGGRWSVLPEAVVVMEPDDLAEAVAGQLLQRWGVLLRELTAREGLAIPWREVLWALRRMEARGTVRGGRFVTGFAGEQYALPEALDAVRALRGTACTGELVGVPAVDPLNIVGILTPGPRVPAVLTNSVAYLDGSPPGLSESAPDGHPGSRPGQPSRGIAEDSPDGHPGSPPGERDAREQVALRAGR